MHVKCVGGREASGVLKGYDALLNLVLDSTTELPRGNVSRTNLFSDIGGHYCTRRVILIEHQW